MECRKMEKYPFGQNIRSSTSKYRISYNILSEIILRYVDDNMPIIWRFKQNNDPKYTSKYVKQWFDENLVHNLRWPDQTSDLNPIENLWTHIKDSLLCRFKNMQELWNSCRSL